MIENQNPYCRLESFYSYLLKDQLNVYKYKFSDYVGEVYVKDFNDIESLKYQVIKSTEFWIKKHPEQERFWSDEEWKIRIRQGIKDKDRDSYPGFMVRNRWDQYAIIGFCYQGWFVLGNAFYRNLLEYAVGLYGISDYAKQLNQVSNRDFIFMIPDVHDEKDTNLLSDKLFDLEIKRLLNGEKETEEITQKIFYSEIVKRGYIEILS